MRRLVLRDRGASRNDRSPEVAVTARPVVAAMLMMRAAGALRMTDSRGHRRQASVGRSRKEEGTSRQRQHRNQHSEFHFHG